jgi:uncharacterized RDD family membrane protein YckC
VEEIVTGDAVVIDLPPARFPTRILSHLVDMLLQIPALIVITVIVVNAVGDHVLDDAAGAAVMVAGVVLVIVGYPVVCETLSRGRTVGKLALGLRVVADDGGPVQFRQALVRALAGAVECWGMAGVPALITSMISARGKRLGDVFAGTFVLRERVPRSQIALTAQIPAEPGLAAWAATLDLSALPEPLVAMTASYLARYRDMHDPARSQLGAKLIGDIAARVAPAPPDGFTTVAVLTAILAERRARDLSR